MAFGSTEYNEYYNLCLQRCLGLIGKINNQSKVEGKSKQAMYVESMYIFVINASACCYNIVS